MDITIMPTDKQRNYLTHINHRMVFPEPMTRYDFVHRLSPALYDGRITKDIASQLIGAEKSGDWATVRAILRKL